MVRYAQRVEIKLVKEPEYKLPVKTGIKMAQDVIDGFAPLMECDREQVLLVLLNPNNKPIGINLAHVGGTNQCLFEPREILRAALLTNASSFIVLHNHPSGNPKPSKEDDIATRALVKACELMRVKLLDHIILGDEGKYYSYIENRKL